MYNCLQVHEYDMLFFAMDVGYRCRFFCYGVGLQTLEKTGGFRITTFQNKFKIIKKISPKYFSYTKYLHMYNLNNIPTYHKKYYTYIYNE